ncbi:MAG: hypothetical protein R6X13_10770 [bacterium]
MTLLMVFAVLVGAALVPGADRLAPAASPVRLEPAADRTDTVLFYDSGVTVTWWCSDRDSFGAGVRFTPGEYPCEVIAARAEVNYDGGQEIYLRVWDDDGPNGKPGTVLYHEQRLDVPPNRTPGWRDYALTEPVRIDSGDFYIVWWQRNIFDMIFSSDDALTWPERQWWFFPDQGWVTPYGMSASDHMMRALVRYGTGVEEELGPVARAAGLRIAPNPVSGGRATFSAPGLAGPATLRVVDAAGRVVLATSLTGGTGCATLCTDNLRSGVFVACLTEPYRTTVRSFVVGR